MIWTEVGARIANLRLSKGLTQRQFAELIGVSRQYVGKIENGERVSAELISTICKSLLVSTDYIMWGTALSVYDNDLLCELSSEQIEIGFDILKRLAEFINTEQGNEILIKEMMRASIAQA